MIGLRRDRDAKQVGAKAVRDAVVAFEALVESELIGKRPLAGQTQLASGHLRPVIFDCHVHCSADGARCRAELSQD